MSSFVIVPVASRVLQPPSHDTCRLFEQLYQAELFDPRYSMEEDGLKGQYMALFNEGVSDVTHVWLAYSSVEPSRLLGVALIVQRRARRLHRFVKPEYRKQGIGTALMKCSSESTGASPSIRQLLETT